jgi:hypothetical protein
MTQYGLHTLVHDLYPEIERTNHQLVSFERERVKLNKLETESLDAEQQETISRYEEAEKSVQGWQTYSHAVQYTGGAALLATGNYVHGSALLANRVATDLGVYDLAASYLAYTKEQQKKIAIGMETSVGLLTLSLSFLNNWSQLFTPDTVGKTIEKTSLVFNSATQAGQALAGHRSARIYKEIEINKADREILSQVYVKTTEDLSDLLDDRMARVMRRAIEAQGS